jgi:hypothetical protein
VAGRDRETIKTTAQTDMKIKTLHKAAALAALALAAGTAAQAQINNNDLLLGFTSPNAASVGGIQYDYIIDIGQLLGTGPHQITLSAGQYNDSTFTTDLGAAVAGGNAYVGVFGATLGSSSDVILSAPSTPSTGTYNDEHSAAGFPASVTLGPIAQSGQSVHNNISVGPGLAGANPSSFALYVPSPLETVSSSQGTGQTLFNLSVYESTLTAGFPSGTVNPYSDQGSVSILFSANGGISGVAWDEAATPMSVPEPSTCGIFAFAGLLAVGIRRYLVIRIA